MLPHRRTELVATLVAVASGALLIYVAVYVKGAYGMALFFGTPFAMGFVAGALLARRGRLAPAIVSALASTVLLSFGLLLLGKEGVMCILLAVPLAFLPLLAGAALAYAIFRRRRGAGVTSAMIVLAVAGATFAEPRLGGTGPVVAVADSIVIDAPPNRVWAAIVGLNAVPSNDWVYRAGLACPQSTRIVKAGIGGERVCTLSTGKLVERIEVWDPNRRLRWRSVSTPPPLRELNPFYANVDAPHLHGYYTSPRGEFVLEPIDARHTRLTRRTWYSQRIAPAAYWSFWCERGISHIHATVLEHVRATCS